MNTLSLNFGLQFNSTVYVRVSASNMMGQGAWSQSNVVGAMIRQHPIKMFQVIQGSMSTSTTVQITWSALSTYVETGNSAITSY